MSVENRELIVAFFWVFVIVFSIGMLLTGFYEFVEWFHHV